LISLFILLCISKIICTASLLLYIIRNFSGISLPVNILPFCNSLLDFPLYSLPLLVFSILYVLYLYIDFIKNFLSFINFFFSISLFLILWYNYFRAIWSGILHTFPFLISSSFSLNSFPYLYQCCIVFLFVLFISYVILYPSINSFIPLFISLFSLLLSIIISF